MTGDRPLSTAQAGVWMAHQLAPGRAVFRLGELIDIEGPLDADRFETALRRAHAETDALHLVFDTDDDGMVRQRVAPRWDWPLPRHDLRADPDPMATVHRAARESLDTEIGLEPGRLFRFALFRVSDRRHVLYQGFHHVAMDGVGCSLFVRRVAELYTALRADALAPPPAYGSVHELAASRAAYLGSPEHERDRRFWLGVLDGWAGPAGAPASGTAATRLVRTLPEGTGERAAALAGALGGRTSRVLVGAAAAFLARRDGRDDVVLGLPLAGRVDPVERRTPGLAANVLPLPVRLGDAGTVAEVVARVSASVREVLVHQRYRGEDLHRDARARGLDCPRHFGPVVNVMLFDREVRFGPARGYATNVALRDVEDLALSLYGRPDGSELRADLEVDPARHPGPAAEALCDGFTDFLTRFAAAAPADPVPG